MTMPANPTPAALAALEIAAKKARDCGCDRILYRNRECSHDAQFNELASPDVILALLAAARQGEEDTAAKSLREAAGCAFDAIDIHGAIEETAREARNILGPALTAYDRAARAASQPEEVSRG